MLESLKPNLKHQATLVVTKELLVPNVSAHIPAFADMPPVFATAMMIGFIEATCIECLHGHLEDGEHTVGTAVDVSHVAATPEGMTVQANVELTEVKGKILHFVVEAYDEHGLIGKGTHQRAVINLHKFQKSTEAKKAAVTVILRQWSGWVKPERASEYPAHFWRNVAPKLQEIPGFLGADLTKSLDGEYLKYTAISKWESMSAINAFAGENPSLAVVEPQAKAALDHYDITVQHYNVVHSVLAVDTNEGT